MTDERIGIVITDKVDSSIETKIRKIGTASRTTATEIERVKQQLATINGNGLTLLSQQMTNVVRVAQQLNAIQIQTNQQNVILNQTANQAAIAAAKLAAAQAQATTAQVKLLTSQQQLIVAQQQAATAIIRVAQANVDLTTAQNNAATAAQRLATEVQRTAQAATNAATATIKQQQAQTNAATAQQKLAEAQTRAQTATVNLTTAQQRLATEQQRTAVQTQNAAAAADRARLAALQLAEAQNRVSNSSSGAALSLTAYAKAAALAIGTAMGADGILKTADAYTVLQNKLVNVAVDQQSVNMLTSKMFDIANKTGGSVEATTSAFQKFDNAMLSMGKGQEETLRLIETLNKATIVSGATTMEAASGILQLGQAFGSGRLQGDEFRAIMENLPVVADMIAKSMGKTRGELKVLSTQGKITAEEMRIAFVKAADDIDMKFGKTTFTLAQTFVVLNNRFTMWVGELNKAVGLTSGLSSLVKFLGENLNGVAVGLTAVIAMTAVAFGPTFLSMIAVATRAVMGFTFALAANPIGLLIVGLSTAIAYVALFGEKVTFAGNSFVTLKDYAVAALSYVTDAFKFLSKTVVTSWNYAIDLVNGKTNGWAERFRDITSFMIDQGKRNVNFLIGAFVGAYGVITKTWDSAPAIFQAIFAHITNAGATAAEKLINMWQWSLRGIASLTEKIAPEMSKGLTAALDALKVEIPRMEVGKAVKDTASEIADVFTTAMKRDFVSEAMNDFKKRAHNAAVDRVGITDNVGSLRGEGESQMTTKVDEKAQKIAEKRALVLAKINDELTSQITNMFKLSTTRAVDSQMDAITINLAQKKIKLTEGETSAIRAKITAVEQAKIVQKQFDALYEEATGPARDYMASLEAVDKLLAASAISQDKATQFVRRLTEARLDELDPMREFNRETEQQIKLLGVIGPQQEVQRAILERQNQLRREGKEMSAGEIADMTAKLELLQRTTDMSKVMNEQYNNNTTAKQTELTTKQAAYNEMLKAGTMNTMQYGIAMQQLAVDSANLKLSMGDGGFEDMIMSSLGRITAGYQGVMSGMSSAFGDFFTSFTDGFADSVGKAIVYSDSLGDAMVNLSKEIVSGLISALVKLGIQYALNAALGTTLGATALATQTTASVAAAGITASAWAVPAAMVSLASFGANSVPAMAGITATAAMSQGIALASMLPGFEVGGYTGNVGRSDIAGVVHGQEFVMDADATRRNRPILEAMNRGERVSSAPSGGSKMVQSQSSGGVTVVVENYGTDIQVEQLDEGNIRIIARQVANEVVREQAPSVIAASMRAPNSVVSKSMAASTNVTRKRNG